MRRPIRPRRGLPLRAVAPNAITALALCSGLSGVQFAIKARMMENDLALLRGAELAALADRVATHWQLAVAFVLIAGLLDGIDGRIARLLHGESRFGAELDSLADAISFGVSPALILYLWSLSSLPRFGWIAALMLAVFAALRLARFNANIDADDQPHKSAGFLTGVPAPAGAGLALLPMFLWFWTEEPALRSPYIVAPWTVLSALLMVSSLATWSWSSLRLRRNIRFEALALVVIVAAAAVTAPWHTVSAISIAYLLALPFSIASYARVKRLRASGMQAQAAPVPPNA
ncbi:MULTISPECIES: CDP-alcohol phosphatidyltransferase family protein [unclassified Sphingomonas]|uniref:CDP-alcohol phosphatidyltransferase family protein n=1 Tax=unclassified Sphingomonas TaxID=196159 RepID=UPI001D112F43|nr:MULTISPECIES: phosphatidylcholine/phosphatidylserine synthase [unclassified Sphingomonas]MCC2978865.1 phosphatidylcholine/phosphatidylserine synthase [Sphingomonas sp. IC4-52]MCD2315868.1 phosphatidylcholine/phosphatidylserine synthase [Sphingomonas sp. IC-11]